MPIDTAPGTATATPTNTGGRSAASSDTPPQHSMPNSSARGRGNRQSGDTAGQKAARDRLNSVANLMSAGKVTSREQTVVEDDQTAHESGDREAMSARGVSDSPAIAPTEAPKKEPSKPVGKQPAPKPEPTAEEKAAAQDKAKRVSAAERALLLDGWEPADIKALSEDKILKIGAHRAKNQADVNREFAKLRAGTTAIAKPAEPVRNPDGTFAAPQKETAADGADAPGASGISEVDGMIDAVAEELGEPAAKLLKSINAHWAAKFKSQGEIGDSVSSEIVYSQGRQLVEAEYADPYAAAPESFDDVAENFKALIASGRYGRGEISKAWRDAAFMKYGAPDTTRKTQRAMLARQDAANKGRVDPGTGDNGAPTDAPITDHRQALQHMAKLMAENPSANRDELMAKGLSRIRGNR